MYHLPLHGHPLPWPHLSQLVSSYTLFVSFMILLLIVKFLLMVFFHLLVEFGFPLFHRLFAQHRMLFLPLLCLLMNFHLMGMLIFPLLSLVRIDTLMLLTSLLLLNNVLLMMMSLLTLLRRQRTCYYLTRTW